MGKLEASLSFTDGAETSLVRLVQSSLARALVGSRLSVRGSESRAIEHVLCNLDGPVHEALLERFGRGVFTPRSDLGAKSLQDCSYKPQGAHPEVFVDVKTRNCGRTLHQPNLISSARLKRFLASGKGVLWYIFVDYTTSGTEAVLHRVQVVPVHCLDPAHLCVRAQGRGVLQYTGPYPLEPVTGGTPQIFQRHLSELQERYDDSLEARGGKIQGLANRLKEVAELADGHADIDPIDLATRSLVEHLAAAVNPKVDGLLIGTSDVQGGEHPIIQSVGAESFADLRVFRKDRTDSYSVRGPVRQDFGARDIRDHSCLVDSPVGPMDLWVNVKAERIGAGQWMPNLTSMAQLLRYFEARWLVESEKPRPLLLYQHIPFTRLGAPQGFGLRSGVSNIFAVHQMRPDSLAVRNQGLGIMQARYNHRLDLDRSQREADFIRVLAQMWHDYGSALPASALRT